MSLPSPLESSAEIDRVEGDPDGGEVALVMVETRPWDRGPDQLRQLREKTSAYLGLAVGGQLASSRPDLAGRPVRLQLDCRDRVPEGEVARTIEQLCDTVQRYGMRFVVRVTGDGARPG